MRQDDNAPSLPLPSDREFTREPRYRARARDRHSRLPRVANDLSRVVPTSARILIVGIQLWYRIPVGPEPGGPAWSSHLHWRIKFDTFRGSMPQKPKRIPVVFFATATGREPVRE